MPVNIFQYWMWYRIIYYVRFRFFWFPNIKLFLSKMKKNFSHVYIEAIFIRETSAFCLNELNDISWFDWLGFFLFWNNINFSDSEKTVFHFNSIDKSSFNNNKLCSAFSLELFFKSDKLTREITNFILKSQFYEIR